MPLKKTSGKECVKILCNKFGFSIVRQKGSHIVLKKNSPEGTIGTVVPNHSELKIGTLKGLLELAKVSEEEFEKFQWFFDRDHRPCHEHDRPEHDDNFRNRKRYHKTGIRFKYPASLVMHMATRYNVLVEKGEDGYLIAEVVELSGCRTQAKSYDELMKRIKEAISLYRSEKPTKHDAPSKFLGLQQVEVW
jgi:predicted RNase H-like HicB family nuclease/predicted RNA binding protein YcfA (HicA-like mRNA interferase family)